MADTGDISVGSVIRFNGELYQITEYIHRTPGNLRAFYQAKLRNLKNGKQTENRFRAGESVEVARVEYKMMQYLFKDGEHFVMMDPETFEQHYISAGMIGDGAKYLKEEMLLKIAFEGDAPILAEPPTFVELMITYSEPGVKGDTATNTLKTATLETGAVVNVPLFVNEGEKIKVDTRTGAYVERVK